MEDAIPQEQTAETAKQPVGLFGKLVAARRLINAVPKNGTNTHHKFDFATHDDITEACKAAMDAVGIAMLPLSIEAQEVGKNTRSTITWLLVDPETGESQQIVWQGDGQDTQDKALYKSITQNKKTLFLSLYQIVTGDQEADGDYGHGHDSNKAAKGKASAQKTQPQQTQRSYGNDTNERPRNDGPKDKAPAKNGNGKPAMFVDLEKERQDKARAKFWALANDLFGDKADSEGKSFCKGFLAADESGSPSLRASTVEQVSNAIKALEKHHLAMVAATGRKD